MSTGKSISSKALVLSASLCAALLLGGCFLFGPSNNYEGSSSLIDRAFSSGDKETLRSLPSEQAWKWLDDEGTIVGNWVGIGNARKRFSSATKAEAVTKLNDSEVPSQALDNLVNSASRDLHQAIMAYHQKLVASGDSSPIVVAMGKVRYEGDSKKFGRTVNRIYDKLAGATEFQGKVAFVRYTESESDDILRKVAGEDYTRAFQDPAGRLRVGPDLYPPSAIYVLTGDADIDRVSEVRQKVVLEMRLAHPQSKQTIPGTFTNTSEHIYLHPYHEADGYTGPMWISQSTNSSLEAAYEAAEAAKKK